MILLWVWLAPARAREGLVGTGVWGERPGRTTLAALGIKVEEATLQTLATLGDPEVLEEAALSGGVDVRDRDGRIVSKKTDVGAALREGTSFVLRLEEMESSRLRPVLAAAEALGAAAAAAFLAPTTVHAYVTGKGGQALETHTDPHDVVALQIGGSKLWELCEVSTSTNETSIAMRAEIAEVELGSGGCTSRDTLRAKGLVGCEKTQLVPPEVFYVPKGVPHSAVSREFSLHVTVGIGRITWVEVFEALANNWRADDDSFRRALSTLADAPTRDIALWRAAFPTRHLTFVEESIVVSRDIDAIFADYCERLFWKAAVSTPEGACDITLLGAALNNIVLSDGPAFPFRDHDEPSLRWLRSLHGGRRRRLEATLLPTLRPTSPPTTEKEACDQDWVCNESCDRAEIPCNDNSATSCDQSCDNGRQSCDSHCDENCPENKSCDDKCKCTKKSRTSVVVGIILGIIFGVLCPVACCCAGYFFIKHYRDRRLQTTVRPQQRVELSGQQVQMTHQQPAVVVGVPSQQSPSYGGTVCTGTTTPYEATVQPVVFAVPTQHHHPQQQSPQHQPMPSAAYAQPAAAASSQFYGQPVQNYPQGVVVVSGQFSSAVSQPQPVVYDQLGHARAAQHQPGPYY